MTFSERIAVVANTRTLGHGIDLQRSIDTVSGIRNRYSVLHELGHYELAYDDAPDAIIAPFPSKALEQPSGRVNRAHTSNQPAISVRPPESAEPFSVSDLAEAIRPSLFLLGAVLRKWLQAQAQAVESQPQSLIDQLIRLRISRAMRVRVRSGALFADDWLTYVSLMDNLLTRFHLERALQLAALHRRSVPTIVLVLLAVCRRYGHRAEPDDHSLLERHRPTFRGAACTVS